jgi:DNA-binding IscR family transcriptional regulator
MLAWAESRGEEASMTSEELADSIRTNPVVVRRLLGALRRAGLVETRRGVGGGVVLARSADRITLKDAYDAIAEGEELFGRHPQGPNPQCSFGPLIAGFLEHVFGTAESALKASLGGLTVAEMTRVISLEMRRCAASRKTVG